MSCIFCAIARHETPTTIRYEDDACIAFNDLHPKAPTHVLIVPKAHIASVNDLTPEHAALAGKLMLVARGIAHESGIAAGGYKLVVNCGSDGGQVVPHLHLHLLGGEPLRGIV